MLNKFIFVVVLIFIVNKCSAKLPSTITPCHRSDPELEECILTTVNSMRPLLASGDFGDGFNTPPLEPLMLDNIEIGQSGQLQAFFSEVAAFGGSDFHIDRLKLNGTALAYDIWLTLPKIEFAGKYRMKMNILLLDLRGEGNMRGHFENAKAFVKLRGKRYMRDGEEYVKMSSMPMRISVSDMRIYLDNLFNGDKTLGDIGNAIINDNQALYMQEIIPGVEKALSAKFLDVANKILKTATYDELFPL